MRYFDTGVLLKLYLPEPNSPRATELMGGSSALLSALHRLEMQSALGQKLGRREITEAEYGEVREDIEMTLRRAFLWRLLWIANWVRLLILTKFRFISQDANFPANAKLGKSKNAETGKGGQAMKTNRIRLATHPKPVS